MPDFFATNATASSVASSMNVAGMVWLVIMLAGLCGIIVLLTSLERYSKFWAALGWLLHSVKFTAYGAGITTALYGIYLACEMIVSVGAGTGITPEQIAMIIGGYIVFTVLGWSATKVYARFKDMHNLYLTKKEQETPL